MTQYVPTRPNVKQKVYPTNLPALAALEQTRDSTGFDVDVDAAKGRV